LFEWGTSKTISWYFASLDESIQNIRKQYYCYAFVQGFIDEENQITCYTDHQIFERYHKFNIKSSYSKKQNITLKNWQRCLLGIM
jgi:transcription-repair coupling factor (superfamily II helicase)